MDDSRFPRRDSLWRLTPAETAIWDAQRAVELAGCDVRLTDALNLLKQVREKVADFVDAQLAAAPSPEVPNG